jgi:pseudouridine synthase
MANAGIASRRDCEQLIAEGRVFVNGHSVTKLPVWVDPSIDQIEVNGRSLFRRAYSAQEKDHVYIILNKPRRVITTTADPEDRRTVLDMITLPPGLRHRRLYPVGRLDADSTGLILLTDDGELAQNLTHPSHHVPKQYHVSVRGHVTEEDIDTLRKGLFLAQEDRSDGLRHRGASVTRATAADIRVLSFTKDKTKGDRTRLLMTLYEGQNRQIRRMIAHLGHKVKRLERIAIGPIKLEGLGPGEWRMLTGSEIKKLKFSAGRESSDPSKAPPRSQPTKPRFGQPTVKRQGSPPNPYTARTTTRSAAQYPFRPKRKKN